MITGLSQDTLTLKSTANLGNQAVIPRLSLGNQVVLLWKCSISVLIHGHVAIELCVTEELNF